MFDNLVVKYNDLVNVIEICENNRHDAMKITMDSISKSCDVEFLTNNVVSSNMIPLAYDEELTIFNPNIHYEEIVLNLLPQYDILYFVKQLIGKYIVNNDKIKISVLSTYTHDDLLYYNINFMLMANTVYINKVNLTGNYYTVCTLCSCNCDIKNLYQNEYVIEI